MAQVPKRKTLPHSVPDFIRPEDAIFFLTVSCRRRGENQLCRPEVAACLIESVGFRHQRGEWSIRFLLLMPDHLHALVSFPSDKDMVTIVSNWKKFTARTLGIEWQRDFFEHRLRSDESLSEKEEYIKQNPVRAGLVGRPEEWSYVWWPAAG